MRKPKSKRWTVVGYWPNENDITIFWVRAPDSTEAFINAAKRAAMISADEIILVSAFHGHLKDQSTSQYGMAFREGKELSP